MPTTVLTHTFNTSLDINERAREKAITLLNERLADVIDLKTQTKYAHWNVKGPQFLPLHQLFDQIAEHLEEHIDLIAERVTALGGVAKGSARQAVANSSLDEYPLEIVDGVDHVRALSTQVAKFVASVRATIEACSGWEDHASADVLTGVCGTLEKDLWFLEAHVQHA